MDNTGIDENEALRLLRKENFGELVERAHEATEKLLPCEFDFCSIVNAKCGRCTEDCKWCAQSRKWETGIDEWGLVDESALAKAALDAEKEGVSRIGIVASGRRLPPAEVDKVCSALAAIRKVSKIGLCASLGLLDENDLAKLKAAGLERIHCNLETAPSRFPSLCSTHTQADKLATLKAAKKLGFKICCGGIVGMGENDRELVEFAFALKEVEPDSIPVNVLHPVKGTPLGDMPVLDPDRVVASVALLRLVHPRTHLRFAGGRRDMDDATAARCIYAGMSAGIAGTLLTTPGADYADDRSLAAKAGFTVKR